MRNSRRLSAAIVAGLTLASAGGVFCPAWAESATTRTHSWSGWYVNAALGKGWRPAAPVPLADYQSLAQTNYSEYYPISFTDTSFTTDTRNRTGSVISGAVGYQRQFNWFVLGLEYDLLYSKLAHGPEAQTFGFQVLQVPFSGVPTLTNYSAASHDNGGDSQNWLGLLRLRAGIAYERWFLFGTGGLAHRFAEDQTSPYAIDTATGIKTSFSQYTKSDTAGWTLGGGLEHAFSDTISAKVEYAHIGFGKSTYADPLASTVAAQPILYSVDRSIDVVRAGISVKLFPSR